MEKEKNSIVVLFIFLGLYSLYGIINNISNKSGNIMKKNEEYSVTCHYDKEKISVRIINNKISIPKIPEKEGYKFIGWYKDKEYKNKYNSNDLVNAEMKLYAKFEPIKYLVVFNLNGGQIINGDFKSKVLSQEINVNELITVSSSPKLENKTFVYWCTDKELNNKFDLNTKINKNMTLYAKYK